MHARVLSVDQAKARPAYIIRAAQSPSLSGERPADRHETRYRHRPLLLSAGAVPADSFLMQFQSDISDCTIRRPVIRKRPRSAHAILPDSRPVCGTAAGAEAALAVRYAVCALDGRDKSAQSCSPAGIRRLDGRLIGRSIKTAKANPKCRRKRLHFGFL